MCIRDSRKAGLETLFFEPEGEGFSLPPDSPALHVIQHIRDESHDHEMCIRDRLTLYYQEELNLKEIGAVLEVGESRVSQLHSQAIKRLRTKLGKL